MSWTTLRVHPGADREAALAAIFDAGALAVQEDGELLVTHVEHDGDVNALITAIGQASRNAHVETSALPDIDWSREWKRGIRSHMIGNLLIAPPWLAGRHDPARTVVIEPAMAFGTGEHATTRGMLRLLPSLLRQGDQVADVGTGSAILAIAAAKLGASRVIGIEIDPDAIENAEENIMRNGVSDRVTIILGDANQLLPLVGPVRVVMANIISSVIVVLLPVLDQALAPDGHVILSGMLTDERDQMLTTLHNRGWRAVAEDREEDWWTVAIARA